MFAFLTLPVNYEGVMVQTMQPKRQRRLPIAGFDAAAIRAARVLLGMTLEQLEEASGLDQRTMGNWERGVTVPQSNRLNLLVSFMESRGITPADAIKAANSGMDPGVIDAIMAIPGASDEAKQKMIAAYREVEDG